MRGYCYISIKLLVAVVILIFQIQLVFAQDNGEGNGDLPNSILIGPLALEADLIIMGRTTSVNGRMSSNEFGDEIIVSDVSVEVLEILKGDIPQEQSNITIVTKGGEVDGITMVSSNSPLFSVDDYSFLFLRESDEGFEILFGDQGKYDIQPNGTVESSDVLSDVMRIEIVASTLGTKTFLPFVNGQSSTQPRVMSMVAQNARLKMTSSPSFVLLGPRWLGNSPSVGFFINNLGFNDGAASGTIVQQNAAFTNAMNTWNTQTGTPFTYQLNGTTTAGVALDGINTIIVRNQASGTAWATANVWGNATTGIIECDIVFWDQANQFSPNGVAGHGDIESIALHELGHCLGLGHSAVGVPVMFASIPANTIRRNLTNDDIAGTRSLYRVGGTSRWVDSYGYEAGGWRVDKHPRMMADVNDDGRDDVIGFGQDGTYVSLSTGAAFSDPQRWVDSYGYDAGGWRVDRHPRMMADVNGDGRDDVVGFGQDGTYVSLSTGSAFSDPQRWVDSYGYEAGGWRVDRHLRMMADVNGDGKDDVVGFGQDGTYVSLSTGAAFSDPQRWVRSYGYEAGGWRVDKHPRMMADVNGDSKDDIIGFGFAGTYVSLAEDGGFSSPALWVDTYGYGAGGWRIIRHPRLSGDMNNDGRADIVGLGQDGTYVSLSSSLNVFE